MGLESLQPIDNLDDRRELFVLLSKLTDQQRVEFLRWAMHQANENVKLRHNPPWVFVEITNATGDVMETLYDLWQMVAVFGLSLAVVLPELERRVSAARLLWTPAI